MKMLDIPKGYSITTDQMTRMSLTHEGLSRLGSIKDFELITDCLTIRCSRSQIAFVSPTIHKMLLADSTINEFKLKAPQSSRCAELLRSLLDGSSILVPHELAKTFYSIMLDLGNEEVIPKIDDNLTVENVFDTLQIKGSRSLSIEREIKFIASHFYETQSSCSLLDIDQINSILSSDSLVVKSEHDLFKFICDFISSHGDQCRFLLSHLHLEYLKPEDISFILNSIEFDDFAIFLPSISRRLLCPLATFHSSEEDDRRYKNKSIVSYEGNNFEGIFSRLWEETGGNPVTNGTVSIEETTGRSQSKVSFLVDPEKRKQSDWFCTTDNVGGSSFIFDFKDKRVSLSGYSLKAHPKTWSDRHFIKSWKIEGSNNKETWSLVDEQRNSKVLLANSAEGHWSFQQSPPFRFFRIMLTDRTSSGSNFFALHAVEFFGNISISK